MKFLTRLLYLLVSLALADPCFGQQKSKKKRSGKVRCPSTIVEKDSGELRRRKDFLCFKNRKSAIKKGYSIDGLPFTPISGPWSVAGSLEFSDCPVGEFRPNTGGSLTLIEDGATVVVGSNLSQPADFVGSRDRSKASLVRHTAAECALESLVNPFQDGLARLRSYFSEEPNPPESDAIISSGRKIERFSIQIDDDEDQPLFEYELRLHCPDFSCSVRYEGFATFLPVPSEP